MNLSRNGKLDFFLYEDEGHVQHNLVDVDQSYFRRRINDIIHLMGERPNWKLEHGRRSPWGQWLNLPFIFGMDRALAGLENTRQVVVHGGKLWVPSSTDIWVELLWYATNYVAEPTDMVKDAYRAQLDAELTGHGCPNLESLQERIDS